MNQQALNHSIRFIKSWLQFRYEREEVPGFVVAIAHKGKILIYTRYVLVTLLVYHWSYMISLLGVFDLGTPPGPFEVGH